MTALSGGRSVAERVVAVIVEHLDVAPEEAIREAHLKHDLGADSLDLVELTMALEEDFGLEIPDEAAERIRTVGEAIEYVERALLAPAGRL